MIAANLDQIIADAPLYKLAVQLGHISGEIADTYYYLDDAIQETDTDLIGYSTLAKMTNIERLDLLIKLAERAKLRIREAAK